MNTNDNYLIEIIVQYNNCEISVELNKIDGFVNNGIAYHNSFLGIIRCGLVDTIIEDDESIDVSIYTINHSSQHIELLVNKAVSVLKQKVQQKIQTYNKMLDSLNQYKFDINKLHLIGFGFDL